MEGNLQLLYVLLTDCYVYLLRKGARRPRADSGLWMRLTLSPFSPVPLPSDCLPAAWHAVMERHPKEGVASSPET